MINNYTLSDACFITTGKLDSNAVVEGGIYPFYTCAAEPTTIDYYDYDDSVVLIAGNNAQGNFHVNRFTGKFNAYQRTYILTKKEGHDLDYIYYALKLELKRLKEKSQGSQTKFLTMPILNSINLGNRNLLEQQKISNVLSSLDSKIELNNKINKELEAMAKTLYDYWFVQFDFPDVNGKPYKSSGGKMVYNQELKREIPEGWVVKPIAQLIGNNKGGDWGKEQKEGNYTQKVSCIRGADLNGLNGLGELNPPERFILDKNSNKILESHDLIVEISGGSPTQSTGRLSFIIDETITRFENPLICSNFCKSFSLKNSKHFYYYGNL